MESWEKEQILYMELYDAVERVVRENNLTYFQIFGALEQLKDDYRLEFREANINRVNEEDELFDEDDE